MLERARAVDVPFSWIAGDSVYGAGSAIRRWAERRRRGYVLAVTSGQRLGLRPVTGWIKGLPGRDWQPAQVLRTSLAQRGRGGERAALLRLGLPAPQRSSPWLPVRAAGPPLRRHAHGPDGLSDPRARGHRAW